MNCEDYEGEDRPAIAKVTGTLTDGRLAILWIYHPHSLNLANDLEFGPREVLLSDHKDVVAKGCLIRLAVVEDNRGDCTSAEHWCWNKRYKAAQRKVIPNRRRKRASNGSTCASMW